MGPQGRKLCSETGSRGECGTVCRILIHSNTARCSYTYAVWVTRLRPHIRVLHAAMHCKSSLAIVMALHCMKHAVLQLPGPGSRYRGWEAV